MNKPKVAVLLATYNGECWISAQIDSILAQRDVDVTIYISDDCSTDKTKEICSNYSERFNNIKLLSNSERMGGASANFFRLLLSNEYDQHDFVALSDQDDIWKENKLIHAIKQIGTDGFYSSNVTAFYSDGRQVLINKSQKMTSYDYFFEGGGPGCTYVFSVENAFKLREFLVKHVNILKDITYHDWFIYAFARSNNYKWIIDPWPSMYYRQHSNNQIGANSSFGGIIKRLKMIRSKWYRKQVTLIANTLEAADSSKIQKNLNRNYYGNLLFSVNFYKLRRSYKDKIFILIFMWHGIPLKKIGFDDNFTASKLKKSKLYRFTLNDINSYVLSSGNAVSKIFQSAFDESLGKMAETGFPRNDVFFNKQHQKISGKYNVLYMPTLRAGYGATFNLLDKRYDFQFEEIDSFLKEHDITLTLRIHPANNPDAKMVELIAASDSIKMSSSDDVYDEIGMYDCLITDYSSIMFDFALSHKPIIFAAFDIKDYLRDDRGMYFNYEDIASNNIAFSWQDVMFSLKENINVREHQDYKFLLQFHDDQNLLGKEHYYSRKVYEFLIEKLNIHVS